MLSHHIKAPADVGWATASKNLGVPYIILYREGTIASSQRLKGTMPHLFKSFGFSASHIFVHNESARHLMTTRKFIKPHEISVSGCLRMDDFVSRLGSTQQKINKRPKVVFFPFILRDTFTGDGFDLTLLNYFRDVNLALTTMAFSNPGLDLIYKPKPKHLQRFLKQIEQVSSNNEAKELLDGNILIDANLDPQQLILDADVVVGINSTTILEAAIAGKPVVVPYFDDLKNSHADQAVRFKDAFHTLDVASNACELARLVEQRAKIQTEIPNAIMKQRKHYFAKYVSDPDLNALERTTIGINSVIASVRGDLSASRRTPAP